jgi:hypothetical protein
VRGGVEVGMHLFIMRVSMYVRCRWEDRLTKDASGTVFLDVDPWCVSVCIR